MIQKGMQEIMQVDDMELAEVTVCEKGVNQAAGFDILKAGDAVETCIDGSCLIKEETKLEGGRLMVDWNNDVDFTKSFLAFAQEQGYLSKADDLADFPTLYNTDGRKQEHYNLLNRMGWPSEVEPETGRYVPVSEAEVIGPFIVPSDPKVVNEAGQHLGHPHTEDALTPPVIGSFEKGGVVEGANSSETSITKSFLGWMEKESAWKRGINKVRAYNDEANEELKNYYKNQD